jgi:hypothetical protein
MRHSRRGPAPSQKDAGPSLPITPLTPLSCQANHDMMSPGNVGFPGKRTLRQIGESPLSSPANLASGSERSPSSIKAATKIRPTGIVP